MLMAHTKLLITSYYYDLRCRYFPKNVFEKPGIHKFYDLMSLQNVVLIRNLDMFIHNAFTLRKNISTPVYDF